MGIDMKMWLFQGRTIQDKKRKGTEDGQQILNYERRWGLGTGPEENRTETITSTTLNCVFDISREQKPKINIGT